MAECSVCNEANFKTYVTKFFGLFLAGLGRSLFPESQKFMSSDINSSFKTANTLDWLVSPVDEVAKEHLTVWKIKGNLCFLSSEVKKLLKASKVF